MNTSFLSEDLRKADPDRFLLSLFCPAEVRLPLQALFLLNHEFARTRSMVTDTNLGLIRLQWWRDEIAKMYAGGDCGHIPILSTISPVVHQQGLPQEWFDTLIYAREFDLEDRQPLNIEGMKNYADFTTTPLNRLAVKMMGFEAEEAEIHQISLNYGLLSLIRGVPFMLTEGRCYLPEELFSSKAQLSKKQNDFSTISAAVKSVCAAIDPYHKPKLRFLAIQQKMTLIYLNKLKKADFDIFAPEMRVPPPFFALRLLLSSR